MAKLVSKTYGEALFELAVEEGREDSLLEEIMALKKILKENPDFEKLMNHPKILKEDKLAVLDRVFKGELSDELTGFLRIIVTKDRYKEIDAILDYIILEIKKKKGIGIAYVTTAVPLNEAKQKEGIEIYFASLDGEIFKTKSIRDLLPFSFDASFL